MLATLLRFRFDDGQWLLLATIIVVLIIGVNVYNLFDEVGIPGLRTGLRFVTITAALALIVVLSATLLTSAKSHYDTSHAYHDLRAEDLGPLISYMNTNQNIVSLGDLAHCHLDAKLIYQNGHYSAKYTKPNGKTVPITRVSAEKLIAELCAI